MQKSLHCLLISSKSTNFYLPKILALDICICQISSSGKFSLTSQVTRLITKQGFFLSGFFSRTFTIHRTAGKGGSYFFILPLPPASQTLRNQPGNYCRELTSAHSQQSELNREPLVSVRHSLTTTLRALILKCVTQLSRYPSFCKEKFYFTIFTILFASSAHINFDSNLGSIDNLPFLLNSYFDVIWVNLLYSCSTLVHVTPLQYKNKSILKSWFPLSQNIEAIKIALLIFSQNCSHLQSGFQLLPTLIQTYKQVTL